MKRYLVLLAACHAADAPAGKSIGGAPVVDTRPPASVYEMLESEVGRGKSVAIVGDERGLVAISSDGARERVVIADKDVRWVVCDSTVDVVWFGVDGTVRALDLDAPKPVAVDVITNVPDNVAYQFVINHSPASAKGEDAMMAELGLSTDLKENRLILRTDPPSVTAAAGLGGYGDEAIEDKVKPARLEVEFVRGLAKRTKHPVYASWFGKEITLPVNPAKCTDAECGKGMIIDGSHYARVVVESQSDGYRTWLRPGVYDLTAKRFLDEWTEKLAWGAIVSPDREAFVADGRVYNFATGPHGALDDEKPHARFGGWIEGGIIFPSM